MELGYHEDDDEEDDRDGFKDEEEDANDDLDDEERGGEDIDTKPVRLTMLGRDCVQFPTALWQPKNIQHCLSLWKFDWYMTSTVALGQP